MALNDDAGSIYERDFPLLFLLSPESPNLKPVNCISLPPLSTLCSHQDAKDYKS